MSGIVSRWCMVAAALAVLLCAAPRVCAAPPAEEVAQEAARAFEDGVRALGDGRTDEARDAFRRSASLFREANSAREGTSPELHYNAGTAYLRGGDTGRAVVEFLRARRAGLRGERLDRNLSAARERIATSIEPSPSRTALDHVAGALAVVPLAGWLWGGVLLFTLAWVVMLLRCVGVARGVPRWAAVVCVAGTALFVGAAAWLDARARSSATAVVVAPSVEGRHGPDARAYEPSFDRALTAGVEVRIVEERGDWSFVRLADGKTTWLPADAIERV